MSIQVLPTTVEVDIASMVRGIQSAAPGDACIVNGLLVGEWPREDGEPLTLFFVLVAEYAGGMVTLPRAISEDIVRQLEVRGNEATI